MAKLLAIAAKNRKYKRFKLSDLLEERLVMTILDCLDGLDRNVMEYRVGFGISDALTYDQIGDLIGCSAQNVSNIEEEALKRIVLSCREVRIEKMRPNFKTKLGVLKLSSRTENCLKAHGILYVEQLCQYTASDLNLLPGFGQQARQRVQNAMRGTEWSLAPMMASAKLGGRGETGKHLKNRVRKMATESPEVPLQM